MSREICLRGLRSAQYYEPIAGIRRYIALCEGLDDETKTSLLDRLVDQAPVLVVIQRLADDLFGGQVEFVDGAAGRT